MAGKEHETNESIRRAVLSGTLRTVHAEAARLGSDIEATRGTIVALAELTEKYVVEHLAPDLEAFAKHAKRSTILPDDVKLAVRRDADLLLHLNAFEETLVDEQPARAARARQPPQPAREPTVDNNTHRRKRTRTLSDESSDVIDEVLDDQHDIDTFY